MSEPLFVVTEGGPHPGTRITDIDQSGWPLPGSLADKNGKYHKISESQLPPQEPGSRLVRSAYYIWYPDNKTETSEG